MLTAWSNRAFSAVNKCQHCKYPIAFQVHLPYRAVVRVSSLGDFLNVNIEPSARDRSSTLGKRWLEELQ